jgi:hypothetical protein
MAHAMRHVVGCMLGGCLIVEREEREEDEEDG